MKKAQMEKLLRNIIKPRLVRGIPEGQSASDYIEFRKSKYIEDIKAIRTALMDALSPPVLNDLMSTLINMSQFNNKHEHGLLTMQVAKLSLPYVAGIPLN